MTHVLLLRGFFIANFFPAITEQSTNGRYDEMGFDYQGPTFEIIVRVYGSDVAVVGMFPDGAGGWDVACGVDDNTRLPGYISVVRHALAAVLSIKNWEDISSLREVGSEGDETRPLPF